jgi:pimeloyl-ACP methyl ester carboxylesterase
LTIEQIEVPAGSYVFTARVAGPTDGRLVLLLHGFPETSASWSKLMPVLADAGYRVVAPDLRGYSSGARPDGVEHYRMPHLVADVLAIVDPMGGHQFDLVGHDWGGLIGWYVAGKYPDRLRTWTSLATPHPLAAAAGIRGELGDDQVQRFAYVGLFQQEGTAEQMFLGDAGDGFGLRSMLRGQKVDDTLVDEYVRVLTEPGALTAALNMYRANPFDSLPDPGPITVPTLYVWATDDMALGPDAAYATAGYVEGTYRFEVLEGASHWIPEESADAVAPLLLEHLAAHG